MYYDVNLSAQCFKEYFEIKPPVEYRLIFVMDNCISLEKYLKTKPYRDSEQMFSWIGGLVDAMDYMHSSLGMLHLDLKPHNIFVSPDQQRLLIGDFGLSLLPQINELNNLYKQFGNEEIHCCTYGYRPFEWFYVDGHYMTYDMNNYIYLGQQADLFAIGMVFAELLIGVPDFLYFDHLALELSERFFHLHLMIVRMAYLRYVFIDGTRFETESNLVFQSIQRISPKKLEDSQNRTGLQFPFLSDPLLKELKSVMEKAFLPEDPFVTVPTGCGQLMQTIAQDLLTYDAQIPRSLTRIKNVLK
jgi:serine/threonine protein kinase